ARHTPLRRSRRAARPDGRRRRPGPRHPFHVTVEATGAEIQATERWFLDRGLPFFIEGREIKVDDLVRGRSLVVLVLAYFGSLLLAVPADKSWAARLLYAVGGLLLLLAVWAVANL